MCGLEWPNTTLKTFCNFPSIRIDNKEPVNTREETNDCNVESSEITDYNACNFLLIALNCKLEPIYRSITRSNAFFLWVTISRSVVYFFLHSSLIVILLTISCVIWMFVFVNEKWNLFIFMTVSTNESKYHDVYCPVQHPNLIRKLRKLQLYQHNISLYTQQYYYHWRTCFIWSNKVSL